MPEWNSEISKRLEHLKLTPARERALREELRQHLDESYREQLSAGKSTEDARSAALAGLGDRGVWRRVTEMEQADGSPVVPGAPSPGVLTGLGQDLRYGLRALRKTPGFTTVAVLTLALGIAANTAIFSVINTLFLHPPGIADSSKLVAIRVNYFKLNLTGISVSAPDYANIRDSRQIFSSAAALQSRDFSYSKGDLPERLQGALVTWQWFDTLGARPILGRTFVPEEDAPGADHEVVLSYGSWRRLFGGDPAIAGKSITLNQQSYRVIGVMGEDFNWPDRTELWTPLGWAKKEYGESNRFNESLMAVARVAPGVSLKEAQSYVQVLTQRVIPTFRDGGTYARNSQWGMVAMPLTEFVFGNLKTPMLVLAGTVGFVLLICCANVAGLMLARASGRAKELAVRLALGARRWRLLRQVMVESLIMAAIGTILGVLAAWAAVRFAPSIAPEGTIGNHAIPLDSTVLLFSVGVGLASALLFGLGPAWAIARGTNFAPLKEGGRTGTITRARRRAHSLLVVGETALALVLLVGAGLFLKSLMRMQQISPGFDGHGVMTAALAMSPQEYAKDERQEAFFADVADRLRQQPGVQSAGVVFGLPFSDVDAGSSFDIRGRQYSADDPHPHSALMSATPGFFQALQIPLREGRYLTDQDRAGGEPVVVIDENLARQYWPGRSPLGDQVGGDKSWARIVGVVGHVDRSTLVGDSGKGIRYYPLLQMPIPVAHVAVRTAGDPAGLTGAIRQAVRGADPAQVAVYDFKPMEERIRESLGPQRFGATMLAAFAAIALLMAALGLYGVVSYSVAQRTEEIGIRMALGARVSQVLGMVLNEAMRLVLAGVVIGLIAGAVLARTLSSELVQVSAFDPLTFAGMSAVLVLAAAAASWLPARRASRVDPMVALRYE